MRFLSFMRSTRSALRLTAVLMLTAVASTAYAQDYYEQMEKSRRWYADRCEEAITRFEGLRANTSIHPEKYCILPSKEAAPQSFALVIATHDEREKIIYTPDGNRLKAKEAKGLVVPDTIYWETINELGRYVTPEKDITLSNPPLPVRTMSKEKNTFVVVKEYDEKVSNLQAYTQMFFKPHKNAVRLSKEFHNRKEDPEGNVYRNEMEYTFKLRDASVMPKMFRGYDNFEASPWVVTDAFLKTHNPLQYSRWKQGEPIKGATADAKRIISSYYGGRKIKDTRWLATLESGERSFYSVQFEHEGKEALAAMVCIAEGDVASTWDFFGEVNEQSIWFVDDEGDFMEHSPEIHGIVATDKGLELYVRLFGGESVQYYVLREVGSVWMEMMVDYWIYVWE